MGLTWATVLLGWWTSLQISVLTVHSKRTPSCSIQDFVLLYGYRCCWGWSPRLAPVYKTVTARLMLLFCHRVTTPLRPNVFIWCFTCRWPEANHPECLQALGWSGHCGSSVLCPITTTWYTYGIRAWRWSSVYLSLSLFHSGATQVHFRFVSWHWLSS